MASTIPDIIGADRGFNVQADILTTTIDGVSLNDVWNDFQTVMTEYNRTRDPIVALFTFDTTEAVEALSLDGDTMEFERQTEFGRAKAGRVTPRYWTVGYPLEWYDLDLRYTARFLRDAPSSHVIAQQAAAMEASNRLQFREALKALTTPAVAGSRLVNEQGASIYSLYAGSADDAPPQFAGRTFSANHQHYLVSGSTTVDGEDLETLIDHIAHHGYGIGTNERIVILVHPDQGKVIRGFRAGVNSSPYDFIPSEATPAYLSTEFIVGNLAPKTFNGLDVIGSFGKALVVESYYALPGYVIASAVAGVNSSRNALAIRSHPRPEFKGLRSIPGNNNRYPLIESGYMIGVGFGVRNRGAAAVMQLKASGSYTAPVI